MAEPIVRRFTRSEIANAAVIFGKQNVLPWKLYDTVSVANGNANTTLQFFANTRGGQGLGTTNLLAANRLDSGQQFLLTGIRLDPDVVTQAAGTLQDLITCTCGKAAYTLKINQVEYAQGLVKDLMGGGWFGWGTPAVYNNYQVPRAMIPTSLSVAILIPTQTNFTFQFDYAAAPNPAVAVPLRVIFDGLLVRQTSA